MEEKLLGIFAYLPRSRGPAWLVLNRSNLNYRDCAPVLTASDWLRSLPKGIDGDQPMTTPNKIEVRETLAKTKDALSKSADILNKCYERFPEVSVCAETDRIPGGFQCC
jgi:hypothetical protein